MKQALIAGLVCAFIMTGCENSAPSDGVARRDGEPDVITVHDESLMDRAIQKARDTHQEFITALQSGNIFYQQFSIKKAFPIPEGGHEVIWVSEPEWNGSTFTGVIGNEPLHDIGVALGDRVSVTPAELYDWMYLEGSRLVGGYSIRVLYEQSSPEDRQKLLDETGMQIPPIDF